MEEKELPSIDELIEMLYQHPIVSKVTIVTKEPKEKEASDKASKKAR